MVKHVSRILLYCLVFVTPFIFVQNTNELFEFPKMYFVYFMGTLLIGITLLSRLWKIRHLKPEPSTYPILLLLAGFVLSTVFSVHPYTSIWGYFSRFNGGLISVLVFSGIYLSIRLLELPPVRVLRTIAYTVVPISVYAVLQHFGLGGNWESDTTTRAFSTFGQPNWYAAYCAMVLPVILYFGLEERSDRFKKISWLAIFMLGFCGFWYAYSVSGILGLTVALGLLLGMNSDLVRSNGRVLLFTGFVCLLFALLNPGIFKQKINDAYTDGERFIRSFIKRPSVIVAESGSSTGAVQYAVTDSGFIRKGIWKGAIKLAVSSPKIFLIGAGPETFPYEFQKFRPASLNYSSEWNYILNKPHNYYLELLTQNGILGLIIYLIILIKVFLARHRYLTPALFGLFVSNLFSWPTVSTSLLFWVFLALLDVSRDAGKVEKFETFPIAYFKGRLILSAVLIVAWAIINIEFAKQYLADVASTKSQRYFEQGNVQKALSHADMSVKLNPYEPFYYRMRAKAYVLETAGTILQPSFPSADFPAYLKLLTLKDIVKAQELNPGNLSTLRGSVSLYYFLSLQDIKQANSGAESAGNIDSFYADLAKNYYKNLSAAYPTDAGVLVLTAKYQKLLGLTDDYERTVSQIKTLRPDLLDWYLN
jgi:tetratricopeptide (TPR) repeat protein